ncbi:MAG: hypothetical protein DHS20C14_07910 [Phycisphaeraceae bacterium]|nr:MAG: hypothetical protein DHS20C14_07910 [Phycisphaeraceae bacterium]
MRTTTAMLALAASAGLASAQFTVLIPGATASDGATVNSTYTGTSTIFSTMSFSGDLTEINTATFASEADWNISVNGGSALEFNPTTTTGFTGTINVTASRTGLFWANNGDNFQFDSFESFDDGGDAVADAQWDNTSFEFSGAGPAITALGQLSSSFALDTNDGGTTDTELAIYTIDGALIATNDDNAANGGPGGLWSLINASLTTDTTYLIVVGGFNSEFGDQLATAGTATGAFGLNVNGNQVGSGTLVGDDFHLFSFTIPAPGSAALLAMGGLLAARRRR